MPQFREIAEGRVKQGAGEDIVYTLTTTNWGSDPSSPAVTVYDVTTVPGTLTDVTTTVCTGSASATGDVITLPAIGSLTTGKNYLVHIAFTSGGSDFVAKAIIEAET